MKKKKIFILVVIMFLSIFLGLFFAKQAKYIPASCIVGNNWKRDAGSDDEVIMFGANGDYLYYCMCGSPVDDSDLYDLYTYNEKKNEINISSQYGYGNDTIKVISCNDDTISLDFDGEIRTFEKIK